MKRTVLATIVSIFFVLSAAADITVKQSVNGKGLGFSGQTTGTTYIKGNKMRSDANIGDRVQTTIFDLDNQKMYIFDSKKKEADVWDMAAFTTELSKSIDTSNMKVSLKPNGQTKKIADKDAAGYDIEISVPAALGGSKDMAMTVTLSGETWIVKDSPGAADFKRFYTAAADKGWVLSDPRAAKGSPGQARAMTEMYKQLAETGVPYETDIQIKMSASGASGNPLGGLMARMGNVSSETAIQGIETGGLSDDLFAPPAGYKLNQKK
jgi:hypothetical protein